MTSIRSAPPSRSPESSGEPLFDVFEKGIVELQAAQSAGLVTSRELVRAYQARIAAYDRHGPALNAIVALNPDALEQADALDLERATIGPRGPMHGIPVLVKDNFDTADMPTSGGSLALATFRPGRDAAQVRRLRQAGAVILGKTTMHELAAGITNISSLTGATRNPYHPDRVPGGSSGGSAAAVAANFSPVALGSDTCGSIRIPASNQNLVGLRLGFGLASRAGVIPLSLSQDVVGPIARSAEDLAIVLDIMVGEDADDPATLGAARRLPPSYRSALRPDTLKGKRIGVLGALFGQSPEEAEVSAVVQATLADMAAGGAVLVPVTIDSLDTLLTGSSSIPHEFKFDLADYLAAQPNAPVRSLGEIIQRGLHHALMERALRLRDEPSSRHSESRDIAFDKRRALLAAVLAAFESFAVDVLAHPTLRRLPAPIGEPQEGPTCQLSASTGLPAISFPAGFSRDGLPIGIEFLGLAGCEASSAGLCPRLGTNGALASTALHHAAPRRRGRAIGATCQARIHTEPGAARVRRPDDDLRRHDWLPEG